MKKALKTIIIVLVTLAILLFIALQVFKYKVENGFAKDQTEKHNIDIPTDKPAILLFSKTTGFRHSESIKASKLALPMMAQRRGWFMYDTEDAGIFNKEELLQFDIVIWNNSTGRCLTDDQRALIQSYIENGGAYIGIHGSGDRSHNWAWYEENLIGAEFSHHPIKNHIQKSIVSLQPSADTILSHDLEHTWEHEEEWYVFYDSPEAKGQSILYQIDGTSIDPNGNMPLMASGKEFGMGAVHPVAWYNNVGKGKSFYTSLGHQGKTFEDPNFIKMIENAIVRGISNH